MDASGFNGIKPILILFAMPHNFRQRLSNCNRLSALDLLQESLQVSGLEKLSCNSYNIIASDDNEKEIGKKHILFGDFPFDTVT